VGRSEELTLFRELLARPRGGGLYVHGPGGIGKTTLLDELADLARAAGRPVAHVEVRAGEATAALVSSAVARALRTTPSALLAGAAPQGGVVLIDGCEAMGAAAGFLVRALLPALGPDVLAVLAGRGRPDEPWIAGAIGRALYALELGPISEADACTYLRARGTREELDARVLSLARGHPLALSLIAELATTGQVPSTLEGAPDLSQTLLSRMISGELPQAMRAGLEALGTARVLDEALLERWVGAAPAPRTFRWLARLPFVRAHAAGLVPHDLARDVLVSDLRWRNPERFAALRSTALGLYLGRLRRGDIAFRQRAVTDAVFLHRDHPAVRLGTDWTGLEAYVPEPAMTSDADEIAAMVSRHEGPRAGRLARAWLAAQPEGATVLRDAERRATGYFSMLRLDRLGASAPTDDPIVASVLTYLARHGGVGGPVLLNRHWLGADSYQAISGAHAACTALMTQAHLDVPDLHHALGVFRDVLPYRLLFATLGFSPLATAELDGVRYSIVGRDWREQPPLVWFAGFIEKLTGIAPIGQALEETAASERERFDGAVREALKVATLDHKLAQTALAELLALPHSADRGRALLELLQEASRALSGSPKGAKYARALDATYLAPIGPQERVAEALGLPFSTYRRHLAAGIENVSDALWARTRAKSAL